MTTSDPCGLRVGSVMYRDGSRVWLGKFFRTWWYAADPLGMRVSLTPYSPYASCEAAVTALRSRGFGPAATKDGKTVHT